MPAYSPRQENGELIAYAPAGRAGFDMGTGTGRCAKALAEEMVSPASKAVIMFRAVQALPVAPQSGRSVPMQTNRQRHAAYRLVARRPLPATMAKLRGRPDQGTIDDPSTQTPRPRKSLRAQRRAVEAMV